MYVIEATLDGVAFLSPVSLPTVSVWGDVVGDFDSATQSWTGPDGGADFSDMTAVVDRFRGLPETPILVQADVAPGLPDRAVDFADIPAIVDAFRVLPYPFEGPSPCPE